METCIVIAKLLGVLLSENISQETEFYKIQCNDSEYNVVLSNDELKEVQVLKINNNFSYNIQLKN